MDGIIMYLRKCITILVVTYLGLNQASSRAEIERRTNPDDIKFFQNLGPWIGLLPGVVVGSGLGMWKVTEASTDALVEAIVNHGPEILTSRSTFSDGVAAILGLNLGLLTGALQGGVYGAYAGLLLGAGFGINLDRRINNVMRFYAMTGFYKRGGI